MNSSRKSLSNSRSIQGFKYLTHSAFSQAPQIVTHTHQPRSETEFILRLCSSVWPFSTPEKGEPLMITTYLIGPSHLKMQPLLQETKYFEEKARKKGGRGIVLSRSHLAHNKLKTFKIYLHLSPSSANYIFYNQGLPYVAFFFNKGMWNSTSLSMHYNQFSF